MDAKTVGNRVGGITSLNSRRGREGHSAWAKIGYNCRGQWVLSLDTEFRSISRCRVPSTSLQQNAIPYVESVDYKTVRISQNGEPLFSGGTGSCRIRAAPLQISPATDRSTSIEDFSRYPFTSRDFHHTLSCFLNDCATHFRANCFSS